MPILRRLLLLAVLSTPLYAHSGSFTCVSLDYPPLIYKDSQGKSIGLAVDIATHVFRQLGHSLKVDIYPWARSLEIMRTGQADCIFTIFRTPEREQFLDYSKESIIPQIIYLYVRKDSNIAFDGNLHRLKDLRVGTAYKVQYGTKFEAARPWLNVFEAATIELNFQQLLHSRVDVIPSNLYTATATLSLPAFRGNSEQIVKLPVPVESVASHIAFPKKKKLTALRDSFDTEFRKFVASGEYRRWLDKYRIESTPELTRFLDRRR